MDGSPSMALLTDLGQRAKTVRQLVVWLKKIGNCQALDTLEYKGKLILIRLVKKRKKKQRNKNNGAYCDDVDAPVTHYSLYSLFLHSFFFVYSAFL